jgi:NAD-dependent protein deacetylase/lipoamidase
LYPRLSYAVYDLGKPIQKMKKVVVFTGSGISAESGIKTFRDSGGLWENHNINDVATPEAWEKDPKLVLEFYNARRKQVIESQPNAAHKALAALEKNFDVTIITQNVDDLHERAGSTRVVHLHGEIRKARSTGDAHLIYDIDGWELNESDKCEQGYPLRPHIVWFGEMVPMMSTAASIVTTANIFIVTGTSLEVYPAASLAIQAPANAKKYFVDPNAEESHSAKGFTVYRENAGIAIPRLTQKLMNKL